MRRLIFTDVHASEPALKAIFDDAGHWDEAYFLGDIVGWGPHPCQCAELLRESGAMRIIGNHDISCCAGRGSWIWDAWTYDQLSEDMRRWILDCPETLSVMFDNIRVFFIHRAPYGQSYLSPSVTPPEMAEAFGNHPADLLICGHSHHGIERVWQRKRYECIRAVGQMRDGDPQTGYTIAENGRLTHYLVPYDVEQVCFDLQKINLDDAFRERWAAFIRTAYDHEWSRL